MRNKNNQTEKNLSLQVNPRIICNLLICREGVLQREAGRQVGGRRRGSRRQGALQQGLRGLRRLHRVRQQCGRHQRDGRLLQRVRQVRGHNGETETPQKTFRFLHSHFSDFFILTFQTSSLLYFRFARKQLLPSLMPRFLGLARYFRIVFSTNKFFKLGCCKAVYSFNHNFHTCISTLGGCTEGSL